MYIMKIGIEKFLHTQSTLKSLLSVVGYLSVTHIKSNMAFIESLLSCNTLYITLIRNDNFIIILSFKLLNYSFL